MGTAAWRRAHSPDEGSSSDYLEKLFDYANAPIIVWDPESGITRFNHAFERLTGYRAEEVLGRRLELLFPAESREESLGKINRTLTGEHWESVEIPILRKDGEVRLALWNSANVYSADGTTLLATIAQGQDITERKRAEQALAEAEQQYRELVRTAPAGIYEIDFRTGRFTSVNDAMCRLSGYKREELLAMSAFDVLDEDGRARFHLRIARWLSGEEPEESVEYHVKTKDGRTLAVVLSVTFKTDAEGKPVGAAVVGHDITERKRAEEERERLLASEHEARRKAEEAVRARDEFLSVAAHELKTPVTSVRGFAQTLLRQHERQGAIEPERLGRALQIIDQQTSKLSRLVTQLLDISRLQGGGLALRRQPIDLVGLVEEVVAAARLTAVRHALLVEAPPRVAAFADPLRLEQVVANLVDNAIRYSPAGGTVEIRLAVGDGEVEIAVRDHGIGIEPEHLPHVFERFYRAHEGESIAGLGLGLFVSKEIIALHGGRIEVECPPDGGTRVVVRLPAGGDDRSDA